MKEGVFEGLIDAWLLDSSGSARALSWEEVQHCEPGDEQWLWVHLDHSKPEVEQWLTESSGLSELVVQVLVQSETRPRAVEMDDGLLVFLRAVNLNPGADPEDMVSIRMWLGPRRVISMRRRRLLSIDDLRERIRRGQAPDSPGAFLTTLVDAMLDRIGDVIDELYDRVDALEDMVIADSQVDQRQALAELRRQAIALRRFLAPQRSALNRLYSERIGLISPQQRLFLQESHDHLTRMVEDLDAARERAIVAQETLVSGIAELTNQRMYVLSIVSLIFLPLSFVTGLLGINVGGVPGAEDPRGFALVAELMLGIALVIWLLLKWRRWV